MHAHRDRTAFLTGCSLALLTALVLAILFRPAFAAHALVNCPPVFLGDYPDDFEGDWTPDVQGLTHDETHWYLTQTLKIYRIPVGRDFSQDHALQPGVTTRNRDSYPDLAAYDHFGDMSYFNGYVLLGVDSGPPEGGLALFRADETLDLVDVASFPGQSSAGWVGVDPDGFVYSSVSGPTEFRKYSVNWADLETNGLTITFEAAIPITDENGDPYQLKDMQGGVVTPDGKVLIVSNGFDDCDNPTYGLHAFNLETGQRIIRSCESGCGWIFQWDACDVGFLDEEPEGLTIWDLDNGAAPGMSGQLHVLLLNNDLIKDNAWMKHYDLDMTPPEVACPQSITVECSQHHGTPASDPAIAAFLSGASATDNCDEDVDIAHDAPEFFHLGTTTVTFTATDDVMANQSNCMADVTIVDTTAPVIGVSLNRDVLWPANHKLADIEATVEVTDICDPDATFTLQSVVSSEPSDNHGDGHTMPDIVGAETGTDDTAFQLRSEREGEGAGRVYTIIYCATDISENVACDTVTVDVPHDQGGVAMAADGFAPDGKSFVPDAARCAFVIPSSHGFSSVDIDGTWIIVKALDATAIDASRVYVGNTNGALRPQESRLLDVNGDTLDDLVVYYDTKTLLALGGGDGRVELRGAGPIGLHYTGPDGTDYLAPNIFALGTPARRNAGASASPPIIHPERPTTTSLLGVYPNPFNPSTTVRFALASSERVRVRLYNVQGALVRTLLDDDKPAGEHDVEWDGRDNDGNPLASGIYFVHMRAGSYQTTRKVVMLK
jgi:hypothetical protein